MENISSPDKGRPVQRSLIYLVISVIVLAVILLAIQNKGYLTQNSRSAGTPASGAAQVTDPSLWMKLVSGTNSTNVQVNKFFSLNVIANAANPDIEAYDVLLAYDPALLELVKVESNDSRFQAIPYTKKAGYISVTGTKSLSFNNRITLKGTSLLSVFFKAKKNGTATVTILPTSGPESTKMVANDGTILKPRVEPISITAY